MYGNEHAREYSVDIPSTPVRTHLQYVRTWYLVLTCSSRCLQAKILNLLLVRVRTCLEMLPNNHGFSRCCFFLRCGAVRFGASTQGFSFNKTASQRSVRLSKDKIHTAPHRTAHFPRCMYTPRSLAARKVRVFHCTLPHNTMQPNPPAHTLPGTK